jgi:predicted PurR-regulated permease PerM
MTKREKLLIFLGLLAFFLFNYPFLHIFNQNLCPRGIPLLMVYLFGVWLLIIVVLLVGKNWLASKD